MSESSFTNPPTQEISGLTAPTLLKHFVFFLVTFFTTTISINIYPFGSIAFLPDFNPQTWSEVFETIPLLPVLYFQFLINLVIQVFTNYELLAYGLKFSLSFLFILTCHELGHYIACRLYKVDATLPYYIPTPPLIGIGTLGAFIKISSPLPSRKATFDIGLAGPIAGFIAIIPVTILSFATMKYSDHQFSQEDFHGITFSDPLLIKGFAYLFNHNLNSIIEPNPYYIAVWFGLLVTALNLIPSGQLDGGHAIYAVFGEKVHKWTGKIAFVVMVMLSAIGWYYFNSPGTILFTVILAIMMRIRHPEPLDDSPLDFKRKVIAFLTLIIFILSFVPFPIQIT